MPRLWVQYQFVLRQACGRRSAHLGSCTFGEATCNGCTEPLNLASVPSCRRGTADISACRRGVFVCVFVLTNDSGRIAVQVWANLRPWVSCSRTVAAARINLLYYPASTRALQWLETGEEWKQGETCRDILADCAPVSACLPACIPVYVQCCLPATLTNI